MFQIVTTREPVKLTDPMSIRALAHPARLAVIEELYSGRELTATECAEIAGLSPSAMSYHLRNLEKAGIVQRAEPTGDGRERPWRAAGAYLQVQSESGAAEAGALGTTVLSRLTEQFAQWLQRRKQESAAWRDAATVASGQLWLRAEELAEVDARFQEILDRYRDRSIDDHPDDARRVRVAMFAFPAERPAERPAARPAEKDPV